MSLSKALLILALLSAASLGPRLGAQSRGPAPMGGPESGGEPAPGLRRFEAREVLEALAEAYPGRISAPELREGQWSFRLDGELFLWAEGRLLPAASAAASKPAALSAQPFYPYPRELPPLLPLSPAERSRLDAALAERDRNPPSRDPSFLDRLWGAPDEKRAYAAMKTIRFLGKSLLVHRELLEELAHIEAEILEAAGSDRELEAWVAGLGTASGYSWRPIAGTRSRSYHSYGAAIDLLPARTGGRQWYWLDARAAGLPWRELPYAARLSVPAPVLAAFERRGFIWGGKWLYWDAVHFEYRPEILILNGFEPELQRRLPQGALPEAPRRLSRAGRAGLEAGPAGRR